MLRPRVEETQEDESVKQWQGGVKWILIGLIGLNLSCSDDSASDRGSGTRPPPAPVKSVLPTVPAVIEKPPAEPPAVDTRTQEEIVEAGRGAYMANCTACHNIDATKDGALGPAVSGASLELLEARVLRSEYPEGYTPKRDTRIMVALRHLEPQMKELSVYLDSLQEELQ